MTVSIDRSTSRSAPVARRSVVLKQVGAVCGALYPIFTYIGYYTLGGAGSAPPRDAPPDAFARYFATNTTTQSLIGLYVELIGLACLMIFVATLWTVLRAAEGAPGWLSATAFGGGVMMASMKMASAAPYIVAMQRSDEGLDPQLARTMLDMNNAGFVLTWFPLAILIGATALVILRTAVFPRWMGWVAAVLSIALLIAAPAMWSIERAMLVFVLALIWIIAASGFLVRHIGASERPPPTARSNDWK